jgi:hypothetical protein
MFILNIICLCHERIYENNYHENFNKNELNRFSPLCIF